MQKRLTRCGIRLEQVFRSKPFRSLRRTARSTRTLCKKLLSILIESPSFTHGPNSPCCVLLSWNTTSDPPDRFLDICILYTYLLSVEAEWDPAKARSNLAKHGISFADADTVFDDEFAISNPDFGLSVEERFVLVGADAFGRILVVSYMYRRNRIRIISARRATQSEGKEYGKRIRFQ